MKSLTTVATLVPTQRDNYGRSVSCHLLWPSYTRYKSRNLSPSQLILIDRYVTVPTVTARARGKSAINEFWVSCLLTSSSPIMAKAVLQKDQFVKLIVGAGQASPSPPVGPALGSKGVKSMDFCKVSSGVNHHR